MTDYLVVNKWEVRTTANGHTHVVPCQDLKEHEPYDDCWCNPTFDDEGEASVTIHNSMDNREAYERGERKAS